jgi:hypothetical protein
VAEVAKGIAEYLEPCKFKARQGRAGQGRAGQGRAGQGRAGLVWQ